MVMKRLRRIRMVGGRSRGSARGTRFYCLMNGGSDKDEDSWASPAPPSEIDERIARENVSLRRARAAFDDNGIVVAASVAKAAFASESLETRKAAALLAGALVSRTLSR